MVQLGSQCPLGKELYPRFVSRAQSSFSGKNQIAQLQENRKLTYSGFELNHEHGADSAIRSLNQLRNHGGKSLYFYADGYDPWLNIIPPRDFAGQLIDVQLEYQLLWTEFEDSVFQTLLR